jgi:hypothetical protein
MLNVINFLVSSSRNSFSMLRVLNTIVSFFFFLLFCAFCAKVSDRCACVSGGMRQYLSVSR